MSAVPKLRLVERAPEPFHDRSPVDEIDWAEIEREQRFVAFIFLLSFVFALLLAAGCALALIHSADLPPMHLEARP